MKLCQNDTHRAIFPLFSRFLPKIRVCHAFRMSRRAFPKGNFAFRMIRRAFPKGNFAFRMSRRAFPKGRFAFRMSRRAFPKGSFAFRMSPPAFPKGNFAFRFRLQIISFVIWGKTLMVNMG